MEQVTRFVCAGCRKEFAENRAMLEVLIHKGEKMPGRGLRCFDDIPLPAHVPSGD